MNDYLVRPLPYCEGCGHRLVANKTIRVLEELQIAPRDVVIVSDIGCHGIIDRSLSTHTVHGLHGRSVALGAGIAMSLPSNKKVIVFIGDGGATIGLQHLLEAARRNVNLTVLVHNNMLYGMTGGQPSGLTPPGYCTAIEPEGHGLRPFDLCQLVHQAGAAFVSRVTKSGELLDALQTSFTTPGFSLIEILEPCIERGTKLNKKSKYRELAEQAGLTFGSWRGDSRPALHLSGENKSSLLEKVEDVEIAFASPLEERRAIVLCGSAGEGVQKAAELFVHAALMCGLHVTKKGSYPVTVGVGFSAAEIILSRYPIDYHGISQPDVVIATSRDGLNHKASQLLEMGTGDIWVDEQVWQDAQLKVKGQGVGISEWKFREKAGEKNAALYALLIMIKETGMIPVDAMLKVIGQDPIARYIPPELISEFK